MTPEFCQNLSEFALSAAKGFIGLALLIALVETVAAIILAFLGSGKAEPRSRAKSAGFDWAKFLEALKGVLLALANLPRWVAIFLAGLALLWMAGQRPEACPAPPAPPPQGGP